jgi:hypothetical protein
MFKEITTTAKVIAGLAIVALILGLFALRSCNSARTAKTETRLATGQRGAAIESGTDAVQTTGNISAAETARQTTVKEGSDAINAAPAGDSNDAAERAACRLRSYRHSGKCIALLGPIAE